MRSLVSGNGSVLSQLEPLQERSADAVCPPSSTSGRMQQYGNPKRISHRGDQPCCSLGATTSVRKMRSESLLSGLKPEHALRHVSTRSAFLQEGGESSPIKKIGHW